LKCKPPDTIEFARYKKPGINGNYHNIIINPTTGCATKIEKPGKVLYSKQFL
jgi:hypothetical protein